MEEEGVDIEVDEGVGCIGRGEGGGFYGDNRVLGGGVIE